MYTKLYPAQLLPEEEDIVGKQLQWLICLVLVKVILALGLLSGYAGHNWQGLLVSVGSGAIAGVLTMLGLFCTSWRISMGVYPALLGFMIGLFLSWDNAEPTATILWALARIICSVVVATFMGLSLLAPLEPDDEEHDFS